MQKKLDTHILKIVQKNTFGGLLCSKNLKRNDFSILGKTVRKRVSDYFFVSDYYMYYFYAPIDPCLEVNCGKHSKCQVEGTEAFCVCDEGWTYNPKEISAGCVGKLILNRIWCMPPPYTSSAAYM